MQTLLRYPWPAEGITAFSTTRHAPWPVDDAQRGRMGHYASFNVTHYCGDDPLHVSQCRQWLAQELRIAEERILLPRQTHSAHVLAVDKALLACSPEERVAALDGVDALLTDVEGVCIGISTADCVPVLLYDARHHACSAVHAGWRGLVQHILRHAVACMQQTYDSDPRHMQALVGPCIGVEAYEVGEEVVQAFQQAGFPTHLLRRDYPASQAYTSAPGGQRALAPHIDLVAAASWELEECHIPLERIMVTGLCTYHEHHDFFSARRLGIHSGRIYTGIML